MFLSGNGPLVDVLRYALESKVFVQDVHGFLKQASQKHLFSGNSAINLAISKIQVLAKLAAKGILGNEQTCLCDARATIKNAQAHLVSLGVFKVELPVQADFFVAFSSIEIQR